MEIDRTDIYARIHKGLRKALFEFSERTGNTDPSDLMASSSLVELGNEVFEFLELHALIEEKFQLPLLDERDPESAKQDHSEHLILECIIACLKEELQALPGPGGPKNRWYQFYLHLNEFIGQYLVHMHHEEHETAAFFMKYCTAEEMQSVVKRINNYTSPAQKELAMKYFMPAMSHPERVEFLFRARSGSPQAYASMMALSEKYLQKNDWEALQHEMESSLVNHSISANP